MEKLKLEKFEKLEIKYSNKLRGGAHKIQHKPVESTCIKNCADMIVPTGGDCDRIIRDADCE